MSNKNLNIILMNNLKNYLNQWTIIESQLNIMLNKLSITNSLKEELKLEKNEKELVDIPDNLSKILELIKNNKELIELTFRNGILNNLKIDSNELDSKCHELDKTSTKLNINLYTIDSKLRQLIELIQFFTSETLLNNKPNLRDSIINKINGLNIDFKNINSDLELSNDLLNEIISKVNAILFKYDDFLEQSYQKRFMQESELLFKKFETNTNKVLTNATHQVKSLIEEYNNISNDFELLKKSFNNSEKQNKNLQDKFKKYEQTLNEITQDHFNGIKEILNEKVNELDYLTKDKILVIDKSYENAQNNHEKFKDLVEKAGVYNLIANYKDKAKEEKEEYQKYRENTSKALYAAIGFTIFVISIPLIDHWWSGQAINIDYYLILVRLSISIMILVLALFFSKQAAKHYECYQENNRTFLQLAALEPFIANMSHEDQLAIRKQLVPTYFNQNADGKFASKGDEVDISTNVHSLLSQTLTLLAEKKDQKSSTNEVETPPSSR